MSPMTPQVVSLKKLLADHTASAAPALRRNEGEQIVRCLACGHRCRILPDRDGVCRVRFNRGGDLRVPFGYVAGLGVDPIEKKPFYHAFPGQDALSFGMLGCDLHCSFCQNWVTSQALRDERAIAEPQFVTPGQLADLAVEHGCPVITSTYNEPLISVEWAVAVFQAGQARGLVGSCVSNGHGTPEVLEFLRPCVDLYKVDLKAFRAETYRQLGGVLETVLDTIRRAWQMGFWVEIVTLIVPGLNDSDAELQDIAGFIASVSTDIPWHVTAFHPDYKLNEPPRTSIDTLARAYDLGQAAGLKFVYAGNLPGSVGQRENTRCPGCGRTLIERHGFRVVANHLADGCCPDCQTTLPGVWQRPGREADAATS